MEKLKVELSSAQEVLVIIMRFRKKKKGITKMTPSILLWKLDLQFSVCDLGTSRVPKPPSRRSQGQNCFPGVHVCCDDANGSGGETCRCPSINEDSGVKLY